jgi:NodT family efflux transporter outer membrane factor (OMF) lipoprotein
MKAFMRSSNTKHKHNASAIAIACGILLVLPGCAIPKLRPAAAGPCLPETFNGATSSDNSSQVGTIEFFNDPRLASLFDQALAGNQQLRILAEDIQIANNEVLRRKGAYLPFLSLGSGASLNKYSYNTIEGADNLQNIPLNASHFPTPLPNFLVAGDVSWQIDIWRQLRNSRDSAALRFLSTRDGWNYVVTRLVAEIAENYYQLMALDKQLETLDRTITLQEQSLEIAKNLKAAARGTELGVQRFQAEVQKNQSQKLIIYQQIIEVENRINFLCGRYPQRVERDSTGFIDLNLHMLSVGVPSELLQNRPDIRQAERELAAAGLDVRVARANFFPKLMITAGVGYEAFDPKYLFLTPESLIYSVAGGLVAPLVNKKAIQADYMNANARQLQALYNYQRVTLNAFTEVVNRVSKVQNYSRSIELKKQQLDSLESAVAFAGNLFYNARIEYIDVLFAQRDRNDARMILLDTKREQLSAIVNAYQALGGGQIRLPDPPRSAIGARPPTLALPVIGNRHAPEPLPVVGAPMVEGVPAVQAAPPPANEPVAVPPPN